MPKRIFFGDRFIFDFTSPLFDYFLAFDSFLDRGMNFVIYKHFYAMFFGKPIGNTFSMLPNSANKIVGDPHI